MLQPQSDFPAALKVSEQLGKACQCLLAVARTPVKHAMYRAMRLCGGVRVCACACVCVFECVRIDVATQLLSDQTSASTSTFCKSGPKLVSCKTNAFRWRRWVLQLKQSGRPDVCTSSNNFAIAEWVTCDRLP